MRLIKSAESPERLEIDRRVDAFEADIRRRTRLAFYVWLIVMVGLFIALALLSGCEPQRRWQPVHNADGSCSIVLESGTRGCASYLAQVQTVPCPPTEAR